MTAKKDHNPASYEIAEAMTSVFRADFGKTSDTWISSSGEDPPPGSALLVIKRGPNAGSRLVLNKPITSAGRHPDSDKCRSPRGVQQGAAAQTGWGIRAFTVRSSTPRLRRTGRRLARGPQPCVEHVGWLRL